MLNLVEKYTAETAVETEEGVVAIEYVIVAGAIVVALATIWTLFGTELSDKLETIVGNVGDGS
jgi:pilus assembly protein Flp/PilA